MLSVELPKLAEYTLIVPGSMKTVFDLTITGDKDSWFVNNISANLPGRMEIKWGSKSLLNTDKYHILKSYKDLWLTTNQRTNMLRNGISS